MSLQQARLLVENFRGRTYPTAFTKFSRDLVADGLAERLENPELISQSKAGLCVPASLVYPLALHKKIQYAQLVIDLFENGEANFGKWLLRPCDDLKHHVLQDPHLHPADWIPLASIRDSENWFFDYESPSDKGGTTVKETIDIFHKAGYHHIHWDCSDNKKQDVHNLRRASHYYDHDYNVALRVDEGILHHPFHDAKHHANHRVALTTLVANNSTSNANHPAVIISGDHVHLSVFTWGHIKRIPRHHGHSIKLDFFLDYYYGYIACKF